MAAKHGAVPLVQINPYNVSLAAIASGQYDGYLSAYAEAVRAYVHPVILSFGYEMNGNWYPWGYTHTSPAVFVAAWRHIVTIFGGLGVQNLTWLWSANIIEIGGIPPPTEWWPGSSYVTWVGIDGYYYQSSWTFASLFGPTIAAVRELTGDPILITETGAKADEDQSAKIADLFAGVRLYGLLGFVWRGKPAPSPRRHFTGPPRGTWRYLPGIHILLEIHIVSPRPAEGTGRGAACGDRWRWRGSPTSWSRQLQPVSP